MLPSASGTAVRRAQRRPVGRRGRILPRQGIAKGPSCDASCAPVLTAVFPHVTSAHWYQPAHAGNATLRGSTMSEWVPAPFNKLLGVKVLLHTPDRTEAEVVVREELL